VGAWTHDMKTVSTPRVSEVGFGFLVHLQLEDNTAVINSHNMQC
jgi:hypothetical protein